MVDVKCNCRRRTSAVTASMGIAVKNLVSHPKTQIYPFALFGSDYGLGLNNWSRRVVVKPPHQICGFILFQLAP